MKRHGNLWHVICSRDNLETAADNALNNKKITKEKKYFIKHRNELLDKLENSLNNETYKFSFLKYFEVYEPKKRIIHHAPFYPDKIIDHAVMNICKPLFISKMTFDTYASIQGRGITMANKKLKNAIQQKNVPYFLQLDIQKFYESIDHDICKKIIREVIKCKKTLKLFDDMIDVHDSGLAIGRYPSSYIANLILSKIDHWAKEVKRIKYYFRYMDDIVILTENKKNAQEILREITTEINKLKLTIKNNTRIAPTTYGIDFIGYKFYPTHTLLRKRIKTKMKKRVLKLFKNKKDDKFFKRKTASYYGWCKHANCKHLLKKTFKNKYILFIK